MKSPIKLLMFILLAALISAWTQPAFAKEKCLNPPEPPALPTAPEAPEPPEPPEPPSAPDIDISEIVSATQAACSGKTEGDKPKLVSKHGYKIHGRCVRRDQNVVFELEQVQIEITKTK